MSFRRCCYALLVVSVVTLIGSAQTSTVRDGRFSVPNYSGRTLAQVESVAVVPGSKTPLFRSIQPVGVSGGVVQQQTPAPGTVETAGRAVLTLTLGNPPPSPWQTIIGQITSQAGKKQVEVPDLTSDSRDVAAQKLEQSRLRSNFTGDVKGTVIQQYPPAGTMVDPGQTVNVTLGVQQVTVPNLYSQTLPEATQRLASDSLQLGDVSGPQEAESTVARQNPVPGAMADPGSSVEVTLVAPAAPPNNGTDEGTQGTTGTGKKPPPKTVVVPQLAGLTEKQAWTKLVKVGLRLGVASGDSTTTVHDESPAAGTEVATGTAVNLVLVPKTTNWLAIAAAAGGICVGLFVGAKVLIPHAALCTVTAAKVASRTTMKAEPAIRFTLAVRDCESETHVRVGSEPVVTRKGNA